MVKKIFFVILSTFFLSLFLVVSLIAGEFEATVSRTQVNLNDSFSLNLTLKNSSPKEAPAVSVLDQNFLIHSQQQMTNTTVINGKISSSVTWKLSLTPKAVGTVEIPSITVNTSEGLLSTQPIILDVIKGSGSQSSADGIGVNIIAEAGNPSPYKNEPVIYTVILTSKMPLYNVKAEKMLVENAIVEFIKEPKLEKKVIDGVLLNVIEFSYLITPLKAGSLTIPPKAIQGAIPQKAKRQFNSFYDNDDDQDPFTILQGFGRLKPFTLMTDEIQLNVKPAIEEVSPWIPAKALVLEEEWADGQTLRVGEPFSRGFVIKAQGLKASQLPRLEDLLNQNSTFKAYADKPEEEENVVQGVLHSLRKEKYTLIPQQAGTWVLPEVSISWWDTKNHEKRLSVIPLRTVEILPALVSAMAIASSEPKEMALVGTTADSENQISNVNVNSPLLLYGIIGILTFLLTAALIWGFLLQRKIASLTKDTPRKAIKQPEVNSKTSVLPAVAPIQKEKKEKLPDLNPT